MRQALRLAYPPARLATLLSGLAMALSFGAAPVVRPSGVDPDKEVHMSEMKTAAGARGARNGAAVQQADMATVLWQQLREIQRSGVSARYWEMMQAIKRDPDLYVAWEFDSTPLFEHFVVHFKDGSRLIVRNDLSRRE